MTPTPEQRERLMKLADLLESGKYPQGEGWLRQQTPNGDTFCCLGVGSEMAVEAGIIPAPTIQERVVSVYCYGKADRRATGDDEGSTMYLVLPVQEWFGIDHCGRFPDHALEMTSGARADMASMNDAKDTFAEIAARIRTAF